MADITNAQAVRWSNERVRPLADKLVAAYYALASYQTDYAAQGIAATVAAAANGDTMLDGSAQDGRTPVTKVSMLNFNAALAQIKTAIDTTAVPGVGGTALATMTMQVNGSPR
jgi:hypothetical protein